MLQSLSDTVALPSWPDGSTSNLLFRIESLLLDVREKSMKPELTVIITILTVTITFLTQREGVPKPVRPAPKERRPPVQKRRRRETANISTAEMPTPTEMTLDVDPVIDHPGVMDHGYGKPRQDIVDTSSTLRLMAHQLVDQNLTVKFDGEHLVVSFIKDHLVEKACIVNREQDVQILVLGKPIGEDHKIWKKYPKKWSTDFDSLSFV
jgi:hypothetical protein